MMRTNWIFAVIAILAVFALLEDDDDAVHLGKVLQSAGSPDNMRSYARPIAQSINFQAYPCTIDCSGHEAGYEWAEENGIDDPADCDGKSESFIEGCIAFAEEQQEMIEADEEEINGSQEGIYSRRR